MPKQMKKIAFMAVSLCLYILSPQVQANSQQALSSYLKKIESYDYINKIGESASPIILKHPKNVPIPEDMLDASHELNFSHIFLLYATLKLSYAHSFIYANEIEDQNKREATQKRILCDAKYNDLGYKHFLIGNKNIIDQMYERNPKNPSYSERVKKADQSLKNTEDKLEGYDCRQEYIKQS